MSGTEIHAKKQKRKNDIQKTAFGIVAAAGIIAVVAVAPNAAGLLRMGKKDRFLSYRTEAALKKLAEKGLIRLFVKDGETCAVLTAKGESVFEIEKEKNLALLSSKKRWDGQWRMVISDIPEMRKRARFRLWALMREIGFYRLQDSVWVFPYDSEKLIGLMKTELRLGNEVVYAVASIGEDAALRKHFKLQK